MKIILTIFFACAIAFASECEDKIQKAERYLQQCELYRESDPNNYASCVEIYQQEINDLQAECTSDAEEATATESYKKEETPSIKKSAANVYVTLGKENSQAVGELLRRLQSVHKKKKQTLIAKN